MASGVQNVNFSSEGGLEGGIHKSNEGRMGGGWDDKLWEATSSHDLGGCADLNGKHLGGCWQIFYAEFDNIA